MSEHGTNPPVDEAAFAGALVLAPLMIAVPAVATVYLSIAIEFAAPAFLAAFCVVATALGAPTYLTFGAAFFWSALSKGRVDTDALAGAGLKAHAASMVAVIPVFALWATNNPVGMTLGFFALGLIFAPLWSVIFAALYRRFSRNTLRTPA